MGFSAGLFRTFTRSSWLPCSSDGDSGSHRWAEKISRRKKWRLFGSRNSDGVRVFEHCCAVVAVVAHVCRLTVTTQSTHFTIAANRLSKVQRMVE